MVVFSLLSPLALVVGCGCSLLCYGLWLGIYRLLFHELSQFPGPKLAAFTYWFEYYYEVHLNGQLVFELERLHEAYAIKASTPLEVAVMMGLRARLIVLGPIVRITPDEIHVSDPDFFVEFFTKQGPQSRDPRTANRFNNPTSGFSTISPEDHKIKRSALEPMFTRSSVRQLLPLLQENIAKMVARLSSCIVSGKVIRMDRVFFALSEDMIFEYGFGISKHALDTENFDTILHEIFIKAGAMTAVSVQFPSIPKLMNKLPDWLILALQPGFLPLIQLKRDFVKEFNAVANPEKEMSIKPKTHRTVMHDIMNNPQLPASLRSEQYLMDESQTVIGAGLSTTGWAATVGIYHILSQPEALKRIRSELMEIIPAGTKHENCTDLDWAALEALPYFQACIKESLRLSYGLSARSTRLTGKEVIFIPSEQYTNSKKSSTFSKIWHIPANTPVSMSIPIINHNEFVFQDSHKFDPERWLGPNKVPDKYFVTFGKGSRQCLGMQLAWAELSLMLGSILRWFDMELYETDVTSVKMRYDNTIPIPAHQNGVKVKVNAEIK